MRQNSNFNSLLNVSNGTRCKRLFNKEFGFKRHVLSLFESYKTYKSIYILKHGVKRWETFSTEKNFPITEISKISRLLSDRVLFSKKQVL